MPRPIHILITAGPTVEDIDPVRFISNRATGTLGFALARAAADAGMKVTLVHGPVSESMLKSTPKKAKRIAVRSAAQMLDAVITQVKSADAVIMNAAVADYTVAKMSATKLKKSASGLTLKLAPTVDILKQLGELKRTRAKRLLLIGFALETGTGKTSAERNRSALAFATAKLASKNLDVIVLNSPKTIGANSGDYKLMERGKTKPQSLAGEKELFAHQLIAFIQAGFH